MEENPNQPNVKEDINVLEDMLSGLTDLSSQVSDLNEKVYTKNYLDAAKLRLDKVRNFLILGFIITFLFTSTLLGVVLYRQASSDKTRAEEAAQGRRQIADCTVKPGTIIDSDYVNPGKCYIESVVRTSIAIDSLTINLQEGVRQLLLIQAEAVASNQALPEDIRSFARQQIVALKSFTPKTSTTPTVP